MSNDNNNTQYYMLDDLKNPQYKMCNKRMNSYIMFIQGYSHRQL